MHTLHDPVTNLMSKQSNLAVQLDRSYLPSVKNGGRTHAYLHAKAVVAYTEDGLSLSLDTSIPLSEAGYEGQVVDVLIDASKLNTPFGTPGVVSKHVFVSF